MLSSAVITCLVTMAATLLPTSAQVIPSLDAERLVSLAVCQTTAQSALWNDCSALFSNLTAKTNANAQKVNGYIWPGKKDEISTIEKFGTCQLQIHYLEDWDEKACDSYVIADSFPAMDAIIGACKGHDDRVGGYRILEKDLAKNPEMDSKCPATIDIVRAE